ncbi:MAG: serine/threonine protein kinase [Ectothiorhodospiraceae bacterium]|nr:serine/threonine protein kinase [Ectothiorhodospiraceae bacterium]
MRTIIEQLASLRMALLAVGVLLAIAPWAVPGTDTLDALTFRAAQTLHGAPQSVQLPILATLPRDAVTAPLQIGSLLELLQTANRRLLEEGATAGGILPSAELAATLDLTAPEAVRELQLAGAVIGYPSSTSATPTAANAAPWGPRQLLESLGSPYQTPAFSVTGGFEPTPRHRGAAYPAHWTTSANAQAAGFELALSGAAKSMTGTHRHWYPYWSQASGRMPALSVVPLETLLESPEVEPLADRIVLVGLAGEPALRESAAVVASSLNGRVSLPPDWGGAATATATLLVALHLALLLPTLRLFPGLVLSVFLLLLIAMAQFGVFLARNEWLWLGATAGYLGLGHALFLPSLLRGQRQRSEREELEETRLALAEQQLERGDPAMAARTVARNGTCEPLLDLLYRVALSHEKRRQYPAAAEVLRSLHRRRTRYRDVRQRLEILENVSGQTSASGGMNATLIMPGGGLELPDVGRYRVERELGRGGMGVVYLATDPRINRQVAVKAMDLSGLDPAEKDNLKERFIREAEAAGRLNHPGIVTVHDAGEDGSLAYIAMDFAAGEPLSRYTESGTLLPVETVFELMAQAAEALDYAHEQGVIHRDMKPANMIYDSRMQRVMITDFGVARVMDSSRTRTGALLGSPAYMAPEQIAGKRVDGRADVFALGVSMYQLLTGCFPFEGDSLAALAHQISQGRQRSLKSIRADLPSSATRIVNRALRKAPEERYPRAAEMAEALRRARLQG